MSFSSRRPCLVTDSQNVRLKRFGRVSGTDSDTRAQHIVHSCPGKMIFFDAHFRHQSTNDWLLSANFAAKDPCWSRCIRATVIHHRDMLARCVLLSLSFRLGWARALLGCIRLRHYRSGSSTKGMSLFELKGAVPAHRQKRRYNRFTRVDMRVELSALNHKTDNLINRIKIDNSKIINIEEIINEFYVLNNYF